MNATGDTRSLPDEQFDALASEERRTLLVALLEEAPRHDEPIDLREWRDDAGSREGLIALHHGHLPKLERAGFVRWDRERHRVRRGPKFGEIEPLLAVLYEHRDELPDGLL